MVFLEAIFCGTIVVVLFMLAAWLFAILTRNGGWADVFWTVGTGVGGLVAIALMGPAAVWERQVLVAVLLIFWAVRLAVYLLVRTYGAKEDARYAELRAQWGRSHVWKLLGFLQIQALVTAPLIGAFVLAAGRATETLDFFDWLGALVSIAGILGAALADLQLYWFKGSRDGSSGGVCDVGLWRLSRHPNYFFEWVSWCAWPIIALEISGAYPIGVLAVLAPLLMYYLLVHVSGIPMLEAHMERTRGDAFAQYKQRTPRFFPRLPFFSNRSALGESS